MWLTVEWHYWAKRMSNSSHRMLALLFITYFPTPKNCFPSGLTSVALLKCNYLLANLQEKKNNDFWPEEPLTANVKLMLRKSLLSSAVLLSRGNIKSDESHYSFVLAQLGVNKMCGFMSGSGERQIDMFQHFRNSSLEPQNAFHRCDRRGCLNGGHWRIWATNKLGLNEKQCQSRWWSAVFHWTIQALFFFPQLPLSQSSLN